MARQAKTMFVLTPALRRQAQLAAQNALKNAYEALDARSFPLAPAEKARASGSSA